MINPIDNYQFVKTKDGSCTLISSHLDDTYHSINGALNESLHVYINNGIDRIKENQQTINILEVGLGTGLNALLTMDYAPNNIINYIAIEPFPLSLEVLKTYYDGFEILPKSIDNLPKLANLESNKWYAVTPTFNLCLVQDTLQNLGSEIYANLFSEKIDIVYYDAFAPCKQPEMWDIDVLKKAVDVLKPNGFLTTYCAQGQFKRNLKSLGLRIECTKGPEGKREMTIAYV